MRAGGVVIACGCKKHDPTPELEARLAADRAAVAQIACERPTSSGAPLPGPALDDQQALTRDPIAACVRRLAALGDVGLTVNCNKQHGECMPGVAPETLRPKLDAIVTDCGDLVIDALARATSHTDGCVPELDENVATVEPARLWVVMVALSAAQARTVAGRATDAVHATITMIAYGHDVYRRGALLDAAVGAMIVQEAATYARTFLDNVRPGDLDPLAEELDVVLGTMPSLSDVIVAEAAETGARWAQRPADGWAASETTSDKLRAACPAGTAPAVCAHGFVALATDLPSDSSDQQAQLRPLAHIFDDLVMHELAGDELALEIAVRIRVARTKACPTDADWGDPELAARLAPARLGVTMTATAEPGDVWRIDAGDVTIARFACHGGVVHAR